MPDAQWYYVKDGQSVGPVNKEELLASLPRAGGDEAFVFGPGLSAWTAAKHVPGLRAHEFETAGAPPPVTRARRSDEIDYQINGEEMQYVEVELDPGEMVIAEAGSFMFMTSGIK